jgi:dephospho-CoA kinase
MRVGLTGGLGSGKSTVAAMLAAHGAHVLSADDLGRQLMQPGEKVFDRIVATFGPNVLAADGTLNRPALAQLAFQGGRIEELNAIVHPAAIALQNHLAEEILGADPQAVVVVESALIFETKYGGNWRKRFERMVLVCAPDRLKIARFCARTPGGDLVALEAEARRRLAQMIPDGDKVHRADYVLRNDSTLDALESQVDRLWHSLAS